MRCIKWIVYLVLCFLRHDLNVFATAEQLMLPDAGAVSQKLIKYYEGKGKQKCCLQKSSPFNHYSLRFVSSVSDLSTGYGILPDSGLEIPKLALSNSTYENLRKIGMFVKVFLGYLKSSDSSDDKSFTPEKTNILVSHVSSIIQWAPDTPPELVPSGFLRKEQNGPIIILLSGNQGKEYHERISKFYNEIYKTSDDLPIEIMSADDIADVYMPYPLKRMVEARGYEPFTMKYLGENIIEKKLIKAFGYVRSEEKTDHQRIQNNVYCTLEFLKLLIQNQDCISRHDTVTRLCDGYSQGLDPVPAKDKETDFKKFVQKYKQELMNAAFIRMDAEIKKIHQMYTESLGTTTTLSQVSKELQTLSQQLVEYDKWKTYLLYCLNPLSHLNTLEKAQGLWAFIQERNDELQCTNPDSPNGYTISVTQRLRKACLPANNNGNHTEQMLVRLFKAHPQHLLGNIKEQFDTKKAQHPALEQIGFPKHLGLIVDSFSWLDVCMSCISLLHENGGIWDTALDDLKPLIVAEGFTVPFPKIDGLFRFVSEDRYPTTYTYNNGKIPPLDLIGAEGGPDYTESGWDFRVLSEEKILLATRYNQRETLSRDRIIEGIQNRLVEAVYTRTSLEFFVQNWIWSILEMNRPFCMNALRMLQAYHPENIPLRIKLAQQIEDDPHRYHLLKGILTTSTEDMKQHEYFNVILGGSIKDYPQEYTRVYFGNGCVAKVKTALENKVLQSIPSFVIDFAQYSRVYESMGSVQPIALIATFKEATVSIVTHWSDKWKKGKKKSNSYNSNYELEDKYATEAMIDALKKLSLIQEEGVPFAKEDLSEALEQLTLSC